MVEALRYMPEGVGSIPDGIIYIFHSLNPDGRNTALWSIQTLTEMSTSDVSCW